MVASLAFTLFLSAFLLFCCQPMVGKMVLPLLGGAASVWTACVLFFQGMLLAGYLYAHGLAKLKTVRAQMAIHLGLLALVFAFLPIRLSDNLQSVGDGPVAWVLLELGRSVAVPFFAISTTAPLLQSWFSRSRHAGGRDPYFLYAASNAGSLLALLVYPFAIEPSLGVAAQSGWWSAGFAVLVGAFVLLAAAFWRLPAREEVEEVVPAPAMTMRLYWLAAAFVPSALLLAATSHLQVNLATVPFLWTMPLAVYLLTFVLAFGTRFGLSSERVTRMAPAPLLLLLPIFAAGPVLRTGQYLALLSGHLALLFIGALLCHSALAERRPHPSRLTEYYAWIALGGVLGGVFAAIIAPNLFRTILEYPLLAASLAFFRKRLDPQRTHWDWIFPVSLVAGLPLAWLVCSRLGIAIKVENAGLIAGSLLFIIAAFLLHRWRVTFALATGALILFYALALQPLTETGERLHVARNFFGVKKVLFDVNSNLRKLTHGDTMHGLEGLGPARQGKPLSYYFPNGPLGNVMEMMADRPNQHIGVVGLGSGTIAAYALPNRQITFFEIDPQVEHIARSYFTFLPRCGARCDVVLGDGRLSIEKVPDGEFDLLVLDAFNSDAIPAHLVSREALAMYRTKLKPNGAILFHVSNRYLRIEKLVAALAADAKMPALERSDDDESELGKSRSTYIAVANRWDSITPLAGLGEWIFVEAPTGFSPWTDDYSNLLGILRMRLLGN
jgi:spermidine synthase